MDEGVDPTRMCQSLVNKVFHSKQIKAVADPEILTLFEDWLEELEEEVVAEIHKGPQQDPLILAERLGLSKSGAAFLMAKLKREERI
jgi:hypothetical protein